MGAITDKLNAEWAEKTVDEKMFTVRAEVESLYHTISDFITRVAESYPTGDAQFDAYVLPIRNEIVEFKTILDGYAEFINWRKPS